jgi:hypothetical protein
MTRRSGDSLAAAGYDGSRHRARQFAGSRHVTGLGVPADRLRMFRSWDPEPDGPEGGDVPDPFPPRAEELLGRASPVVAEQLLGALAAPVAGGDISPPPGCGSRDGTHRADEDPPPAARVLRGRGPRPAWLAEAGGVPCPRCSPSTRSA